MGIKNWVAKAGNRAADKVARLAVLSPEQLADMEKRRVQYLSQMPSSDDQAADELTKRLLAASSVEIYNAYLSQIQDFYVPLENNAEYERAFSAAHNIRYLNITKWVSDQKENSLEKLVNVYEVLSNEECNIALVFHRTCEGTEVYLAVTNTKNADNNVDVENYKSRLADAIRGNFPGAEWKKENGIGLIPCLDNNTAYSVAAASNIPTEKSEKFISQTIEKLLDGIVPDKKSKEYMIILLATPIQDIEERKLRLAEFYSGLTPYASWQTNFTYTESDATNAMATFGVNAGVSAGVQRGQNTATTNTDGTTDSTGQTDSDTEGSSQTDSEGSSTTDSSGSSVSDAEGTSRGTSEGNTVSDSMTHTDGTSSSLSSTEGSSDTLGGSIGGSVSENVGVDALLVNAGANASVSANIDYHHSWNRGETIGTGSSISDAITNGTSRTLTENINQSATHSITENISQALTSSTGRAITNSVGRTVANSLGRAVTKSVANTVGAYKGVNFGGNFGANFARSSNVTATVGKNEGITQSFTNYTIRHTLELLEEQMKRLEQSTALGMWDFAAYVLSEDQNVASNVTHSYLALTQGEQSYASQTAVNLWRGDMGENSRDAREICTYLRELRHPVFGLNPALTAVNPTFNVYPSVVTATTSLSGKELAYSLNFPQKSVTGFPVLECAEFGRNIITYDLQEKSQAKLDIGRIFHMNHEENTNVSICKDSLASHTFVTGSTGSGKSNTVYQILNEANANGVKFLVVEPAKGEYKSVFGMESDVNVYGTNPAISPLLRINPFRFPAGIHVFEHLDRLVEIFNVCWPMYAAMPAVLKNAIEKSYTDCGWDLTESTNSYGDDLYPTFTDVARNIKTIIDSSEYDTENKGAYKGSLLTRLQSLTNGINGLIFTTDEIPAQDLFDENVIIDLSRVGSNETKSLIMGMLVLKLSEYRMVSTNGMNRALHHLTVLEEAHNLLKKSSVEGGSESSNLLGKSVEMIANAIAEMRTYGEGFVIVDQAPGLLDMAAIRNTNTKIIMRLPDQSDRELVGKAANLNDDQIKELAKLPCGVAAIYQNEWIEPVLCKVDQYDIPQQTYIYERPKEVLKENDIDRRVHIAELLSYGTKIDGEVELKETRKELVKLGLDASLQVMVMKMLANPPKEPRMTKLAPIMNALFPSVKEAVREAFAESSDAKEWTQSAENALLSLEISHINNRVYRDIIQSAMTYYFMVEINAANRLEEWWAKGGF